MPSILIFTVQNKAGKAGWKMRQLRVFRTSHEKAANHTYLMEKKKKKNKQQQQNNTPHLSIFLVHISDCDKFWSWQPERERNTYEGAGMCYSHLMPMYLMAFSTFCWGLCRSELRIAEPAPEPARNHGCCPSPCEAGRGSRGRENRE